MALRQFSRYGGATRPLPPGPATQLRDVALRCRQVEALRERTSDTTRARVRLTGEKLTFGETMLSLSKKKWKRRLEGLTAAGTPQPKREAEELRSDLVCKPIGF